MKKLTFLCLLLIVNVINAQDVITKNIGNFTELKVFDKIELDLLKGSENKVEISGISREKIDVVLDNDILKIKMSLSNLWDNDNTKVTVYYTNISKIDVNEGAKVKVKDIIKIDDLGLYAQEGGDISINIDTKKVIIRAVTGGAIDIKGTAKEQDVTIKAGGQYMAKDLKTENTKVKISAGGRASVFASKYVKANTNAGGTIKIYGKPKEIDSKKVFGGKIIEVN